MKSGVGDMFQLGAYELKMREIVDGENENYTWRHAKIDVSQNGKVVKTLEPERRFYKASRQPTSEVAIWRRLNEDLYLNFAGVGRGNEQGRDSGLRVPAGFVDMDRLLGALIGL